jgi:hypothetical protein
VVEKRKEVYIWWYIRYLRILIDLVPLRLRNWLIKVLMADGMRTFTGRTTKVVSGKTLS